MWRRYRAELYLLLCTVLWGGTFVAIKLALAESPPLLLVGLRFGIAALVFGAVFHREILAANRTQLAQGFLLGVFVFGGFGFQTLGLEYTTVARSAFLTQLLVVFTPFLQLALYRRRPATATLLGIGLVVAGMYLLTSPEGRLNLNYGDFLTLLCAISYSFYVIYVDRYGGAESAAVLSFFQTMFMALISLSLSLLLEQPYAGRLSPGFVLIGGLAYLAFLATNLVVYWQMRWQPETTPARAAVVFAMEPVFAAVFALFVFDDPLTQRSFIGAALIFSGMLVSELGPLWVRAARQSKNSESGRLP